MGQKLSCRDPNEHELFTAARNGEEGRVRAMIDQDPDVLGLTTVRGRLSALHVAAAHGRIDVLSLLLDRNMDPDSLNCHKQTPLMLAAMHGKITCLERLIEGGANILMFDSPCGRTCLHYAAYYGHPDCLQLILSAARSTHVAHSWGFARFVNIRDGGGATPLHLAARQKQPECVHSLLSNGALVSVSTGRYGYPGSTPLHLAARAGSLDTVRELLSWGADRLQRDCSGRIPYIIALKHKHEACAALLSPSSPEPLTWPSPIKFIGELIPETKALLEKALIEANKEREKSILKETAGSPDSSSHSESAGGDDEFEINGVEVCCICFEQVCTIEIQECGHQMCAPCTLALCCHSKPNSGTNCQKVPVCPFCRSSITQLAVAKMKINKNIDDFSQMKPAKSRKSFNLSEGSSSFKGLSSLSPFGKFGGCDSGKVSAEYVDGMDKP